MKPTVDLSVNSVNRESKVLGDCEFLDYTIIKPTDSLCKSACEPNKKYIKVTEKPRKQPFSINKTSFIRKC